MRTCVRQGASLVQPQWLAPRVRDVRNSPYCEREDGFGAVDDAEGAGSAADSLGSAFIMLTGGMESEDGNSRLGSTDATGGTTPRERRAGSPSSAPEDSTAVGNLSVATEIPDTATSVGAGLVCEGSGEVTADDKTKSEPANAIIAVDAAVIGSGGAVTGTSGAGAAAWIARCGGRASIARRSASGPATARSGGAEVAGGARSDETIAPETAASSAAIPTTAASCRFVSRPRRSTAIATIATIETKAAQIGIAIV